MPKETYRNRHVGQMPSIILMTHPCIEESDDTVNDDEYSKYFSPAV